GRAFLPQEARTAARFAIVSEATARAFWPGADPIGQTIRLVHVDNNRLEDVESYPQGTGGGTVRPGVSGGIVEGPDSGHIYLPADINDPHAVALLIRPRSPADFRPDMTHDAFRRQGFDPEAFEVVPMNDIRAAHVYPLRVGAWIGGILGGIAL